MCYETAHRVLAFLKQKVANYDNVKINLNVSN